MANKAGVVVRTTLDPEQHRRAKVAAAQVGLTLAEICRRALLELADTGRVPRSGSKPRDK